MRLIKESVIVICLASGLLTVPAAASQAAETPGPAFTSRMVKECTPVEGAAPAVCVSVPALPTGPKEFAVDRPRPQKDLVVSVRDFGADPERDDNSEAFAQAIHHCQEKKASTLVVPNGVYRFQVGQPPLEFSGLVDFTLDGQGSELIWRNTNRRGHRGMFQITGCERIEVKDLVLDCPGSSFFSSSARNVVIRDNLLRFRDAKGPGHASDRSKVFVSYASDVHVVNNRWFKSPHVAAPGALVDRSNAEEIRWEGNTLVTDGDVLPADTIPGS